MLKVKFESQNEGPQQERGAAGSHLICLFPFILGVEETYELLAALWLLGELGEEEEDEEGEKFIPDNSGGSVAVFCPLRLFLHTGQVSCCQEKRIDKLFHKSASTGVTEHQASSSKKW